MTTKTGSVPDRSIRICADRGGTFCDLHASYPDPHNPSEPKELVLKLLSQDPTNYRDAPTEGIRRVLETVTGTPIPRGQILNTDKIDYIRLSTTVATNALLERKGHKHALVITKGFKDLLLIGNQSRPKIFDLNIRRPPPLYSAVLEVDERVTLAGYTSDPNATEHAVRFASDGSVERGLRGPGWDGVSDAEGPGEVVRGLSGEAVRIIKKPDEATITRDLQALYAQGFRSLAVVFVHAYTFPAHELLVGRVARALGFTQVSLSGQLLPMIKMVPRGVSSTADAYLTPILMEYIDGFFEGFDKKLRRGSRKDAGDAEGDKQEEDEEGASALHDPRVEFMSSDGGLLDLDNFSGLKSILSGPAGGVVGYALTSWDPERRQPVIGLDVGGTSTDVSRYAGRYETVYETTTAGITIQSPQLDINTVAAGGGSRLFWRHGLFHAGPESAGAQPGPACYRKGGPLAVTDANLVLGRLVPEYFPRIFGEGGGEGLDVRASWEGFEEVGRRIGEEGGVRMGVDEIAYGFIKVANETMCRPIRALTESRGFATSKHILASFGGAGGQHACEIARILGIRTVLIHRHSSILSAYGLSLADRVYELQEPCASPYDRTHAPALRARLDALSSRVRAELKRQGFDGAARVRTERMLNMRFDGTDTALMVRCTEEDEDEDEERGEDFGSAFRREYKAEFGFLLEGGVVVDDIKVRGIGTTFDTLGPSVFTQLAALSPRPRPAPASAIDMRHSVYFDGVGRVGDTPVYRLGALGVGETVRGPAVLVDGTQTVVLVPGAEAVVLREVVVVSVEGGWGKVLEG